MVNNGSLHYDHDRDGTHTQLAGCEAKFRNLEHDTHIAIRYERDTLTGECKHAKGVVLKLRKAFWGEGGREFLTFSYNDGGELGSILRNIFLTNFQ